MGSRAVKFGQLSVIIKTGIYSIMTEYQKRLHHPPHMALDHCQLADKLIERVLYHAKNDGWGDDALTHAINDTGVDDNLARVIFPDLPKSLIIWASGYADSVMVEWLTQNKPAKITDVLFEGLMFRYRHFKPYRAAFKKASDIALTPAHFITASELTWATADKLWRAAGDVAHDFNHYTKRLLLTGIIASTHPIYLNDQSQDLMETESFLRHRFDDVKFFNQIKTKIFGGHKAT